jgi:hypothetical protein
MESTEAQSYLIDAPPDVAQLELHVFARAYRGLWLALRGQLPHGRHRFPSLNISIEYGAPRKPH